MGHGPRRTHASWPDSTDIGGRLLGSIRAEMLWHYVRTKPSDKAFMQYADRMRTFHRTHSPGCRWKLIPARKEALFVQTGFRTFEDALWEILAFCPAKACGRLQSMDGSVNPGSQCRFCGAALRCEVTGALLSRTAYMRTGALALWLANDPNVMPAHLEHAPEVEAALLSQDEDVESVLAAYGARAQLRMGGERAQSAIASNPLCFKITLSHDDKEMIRQHGKKGSVSMGATLLVIKSLPEAMRLTASVLNPNKFLTRIGLDSAPVNMSEQYLYLVRDLNPYRKYWVSVRRSTAGQGACACRACGRVGQGACACRPCYVLPH
jgi:hypothetical protein